MNYIISGKKVFEAVPPFAEVGEITEGAVTILTLNDEVRTRRRRNKAEAPLESPAQE